MVAYMIVKKGHRDAVVSGFVSVQAAIAYMEKYLKSYLYRTAETSTKPVVVTDYFEVKSYFGCPDRN